MKAKPNGLFITGTDTEVGKTYIGALLARCLKDAGHRVGVYKPTASACSRQGDKLVSDDAVLLWEAAGEPGELDRVCPQCFQAPLAPHLAARAEGRQIDRELLRDGVNYWLERSDIVLVEGAGGLLSPLGENDSVADLARDLGFPLIIVARNALGTINHTLLTLHAARTLCPKLKNAGIILNQPVASGDDPSIHSNRQEIAARTGVPVLAQVSWNTPALDNTVDWFSLAKK
ncbi:MAG: dethiobiotin synthase [Thermoguttaceae bacterium]